MSTLGLKPEVDTASPPRTLRQVKRTEAWLSRVTPGCVTSAVERERPGARTALIAARAVRIIEIIASCEQQGYDGNHIDHWNEHDQANPATIADIVQTLGHERALCPGVERTDDS